jgi:hypothetical protein
MIMVTEAGLIRPAEQSLQLPRHISGWQCWRAKAEILRLTSSSGQRLGNNGGSLRLHCLDRLIGVLRV